MKLNLGCGPGPGQIPGAVNVDIVPMPGVDVVHDLGVAPWPWPDGSAADVAAFQLFEHVADPVLFMAECWRVLEPGGRLHITVPWWLHPAAFTDPTHRRYCTEQSFDYWIKGTPLHEGGGLAMGSPPVLFFKEHIEIWQAMEIRIRLRKIRHAGG